MLELGDLLLPLEAHIRAPPVKVQLAWTMEISGFQPLAGLPVELQDDDAGTTRREFRRGTERMPGFWEARLAAGDGRGCFLPFFLLLNSTVNK